MKRILTGLSLTLLCVVLISAVGARPAAAQATNAITVGGIGVVVADPDTAFFDVSVERVSTELNDAFAAGNDIVDEIRTTLNRLGVARSDIRLQGISITPQDRVDARLGPTGEFIYRVRHTLRVTVRDVSASDTLISAALESGANDISNYTLGVIDLDALELEARALAIQDANDRAQQFVTSLGVGLGAVQYINEIGVTSGFGAMPGNMADSTGRFTVTVQVQITYLIRR
ncbi:MAG: SIMPL domain-containing protein [Anaerolineae bacterium]|nr:SIMPL domain-containing protein [Anaerolineae bacterium]